MKEIGNPKNHYKISKSWMIKSITHNTLINRYYKDSNAIKRLFPTFKLNLLVQKNCS